VPAAMMVADDAYAGSQSYKWLEQRAIADWSERLIASFRVDFGNRL